MFLHLSVCLFTWGGGLPTCITCHITVGGLHREGLGRSSPGTRKASSAHPTGMLSCLVHILSWHASFCCCRLVTASVGIYWPHFTYSEFLYHHRSKLGISQWKREAERIAQIKTGEKEGFKSWQIWERCYVGGSSRTTAGRTTGKVSVVVKDVITF